MRHYETMTHTRRTDEFTSDNAVTTELTRLCEHIAHTAREFVVSHKPPRAQVLDTKSTPTDVVTQMDRDVEALIRTLISQYRPDDAFLGEETGLHESTGGLTWVVDPIDGTVNYLYGLPGYAVSVAVVAGPPTPDKWQQIAGAVIRISDGKLWSAGRGQGAFSDGERLKVNEPHELGKCLTGTGFGYDPRLRFLQAQVLTAVLPRVRDIRRNGAAAVELCLVADGSLDLFFERGLSAWDMAAGGLIVSEAGGLVTGMREQNPSTNMTIAGFAPMVASLTEILISQDADAPIESVHF